MLPALPPPLQNKKTHTEVTRKPWVPPVIASTVYRCLWPSGAGYNLWRALIGSWVMPPSNGSIEIERGGEKNITINRQRRRRRWRRRQNDGEGIESDGGSGGGRGADGRFGGTATAMAAAGTVTVDS